MRSYPHILTIPTWCSILYLSKQYSIEQMGGDDVEIVVSNKASSPLYEQIATQIKAAIMSGELKAGEAIPSVRALAKSLHISILTVQKAYATLQEDGFIETTAGKGCYVSAQNQDFYLEEQQKKIEEKFSEAVGIARTSGINLDKLISLLTLLYQEDD
jgi:GntR family transcriptional regulator